MKKDVNGNDVYIDADEDGHTDDPDVLDAARIKLAECHRLVGDLDGALRWIEAVREKSLPGDLRRILGEIRALVYDVHPSLREEVRHEEVQTAAAADASSRSPT